MIDMLLRSHRTMTAGRVAFKTDHQLQAMLTPSRLLLDVPKRYSQQTTTVTVLY